MPRIPWAGTSVPRRHRNVFRCRVSQKGDSGYSWYIHEVGVNVGGSPAVADGGLEESYGVKSESCFAGKVRLWRESGPTSECAALPPVKREPAILQRSTNHAAIVPAVPPIVHEVLRSPGQPLDAATLVFMEPRFGHDFGGGACAH